MPWAPRSNIKASNGMEILFSTTELHPIPKLVLWPEQPPALTTTSGYFAAAAAD
jgi:hypothetical protein